MFALNSFKFSNKLCYSFKKLDKTEIVTVLTLSSSAKVKFVQRFKRKLVTIFINAKSISPIWHRLILSLEHMESENSVLTREHFINNITYVAPIGKQFLHALFNEKLSAVVQIFLKNKLVVFSIAQTFNLCFLWLQENKYKSKKR